MKEKILIKFKIWFCKKFGHNNRMLGNNILETTLYCDRCGNRKEHRVPLYLYVNEIANKLPVLRDPKLEIETHWIRLIDIDRIKSSYMIDVDKALNSYKKLFTDYNKIVDDYIEKQKSEYIKHKEWNLKKRLDL